MKEEMARLERDHTHTIMRVYEEGLVSVAFPGWKRKPSARLEDTCKSIISRV